MRKAPEGALRWDVGNIIDIDDYREIWETDVIKYLCCGEVRIATYYVWSGTLECPKCGKMTKFEVLEDFPEEGKNES